MHINYIRQKNNKPKMLIALEGFNQLFLRADLGEKRSLASINSHKK